MCGWGWGVCNILIYTSRQRGSPRASGHDCFHPPVRKEGEPELPSTPASTCSRHICFPRVCPPLFSPKPRTTQTLRSAAAHPSGQRRKLSVVHLRSLVLRMLCDAVARGGKVLKPFWRKHLCRVSASFHPPRPPCPRGQRLESITLILKAPAAPFSASGVAATARPCCKHCIFSNVSVLLCTRLLCNNQNMQL